MKHWSKGGVSLTYREDGTLHVYAPDESRVLSPELADDLLSFLLVVRDTTPLTFSKAEIGAMDNPPEPPAKQATVPDGVIATRRGPGRPRKNG